ncbi:MAG: pyruvate, phosphate dikinase [Terrisporobacter othiniensis]|uniref:Pyruvate, phosphate dikinase n=1 Tax=Terrisporobacter hibernicus TaxID=2813371 RepID=A0AAX2ZBB9_9FIRM|nr:MULTISPECIES: pyruvate, phosphate dikinase [Terrisporobacter]MDU4859987.1 pyruvate, phosphate dikinase [Terrisporobacter othiniensis]MDU6996053.1 pyruvate, phosphate dikinase [Terrisporobacter othiniensis]UEL46598.1 pyruvate, phosphate dikinase [Terrisporobacter hibernicus]
MSVKYVYSFNEGSKEMKSLLGGKGANLAEMTKIGLPVPPGFTITTESCIDYYENNKTIKQEIINQIEEKLSSLEKDLNKQLGSEENPLLVSVRSGAVISMPGMMDTILNLGLNDNTVKALAIATDNDRFAYDSYRRFIQMFSDVAMEVPKYKFENVLNNYKEENNFKFDTDLTCDHLKSVVEDYKAIYKKEVGEDFPQEPKKQLMLAVEAVFRSWNNPRAIVYRRLNDIPNDLGTAVNIQSMVFGNMGDTSGTGVAFTRDPGTGENKLLGEYLINAQGEDVVAGIRTPEPIATLEKAMPEIYKQFIDTVKKLENHYKDMQDVEFTIEKGRLFFLQTRNGKRTAASAINVAVDLVEEGLISKEEAIMRVEPKQLDQLLHPKFEDKALKEATVLAKGLPASPGAGSGKIYFTAEEAVEASKNGEKVILVRQETSPEDIEGMVCSQGILTARGGMTSHAAVVARGMGKCCVAGCGEIKVDEIAKEVRRDNLVLREGDFISIDGSTGIVYLGDVAKTKVSMTGNFEKLMNWVDEVRDMKVRTNADNPRDSKAAVDFGAEGIGLCRTEHMFFDEDRIPAVRKMILSNTVEDRVEALDKLLPMQQQDFVDIYKVMGDRPVNIRLLDPPLHEFLPHDDETIEQLAKDMNIQASEIKKRIVDLAEFNPMLGHRGCRLAVTYPEIAVMQTKAIINAAIEVNKEGLNVEPEIMIPLVGALNEFKVVKNIIVETANAIIKDSNVDLKYTVGTMIEIPRACLIADEIAREADFFSFGTNDLTQMTFGYSRDDAGKFLGQYVDEEILEKDPFQVLDQNGVGKLVKMATTLAREEKGNNIKLGICGEHGGDPTSVEFCYETGLNYVSCSPYRVPIARLAAAQATIKKKSK